MACQKLRYNCRSVLDVYKHELHHTQFLLLVVRGHQSEAHLLAVTFSSF